jgi:hypothetical protein
LLSRLGQIDLFIHDSLHSERNVRFELDRAWAALTPNGALVVDDVDANWGFEPPSRFASLDHLVGEREQRGRHVDGRRLGGLSLDLRFSPTGSDASCSV